MKHFLGIDPGLTGAAALMDANGGLIGTIDLPVVRDGALAWINPVIFFNIEMVKLMGKPEPRVMYGQIEAWVERAQATPQMGRSSAFNYGVGFGSVLSMLMTRALPVHFVTPAKWKGALGLSKDKNAALDKARLLYPDAELDLVKHHGRAEAILIAHWARTCSWRPQ